GETSMELEQDRRARTANGSLVVDERLPRPNRVGGLQPLPVGPGIVAERAPARFESQSDHEAGVGTVAQGQDRCGDAAPVRTWNPHQVIGCVRSWNKHPPGVQPRIAGCALVLAFIVVDARSGTSVIDLIVSTSADHPQLDPTLPGATNDKRVV